MSVDLSGNDGALIGNQNFKAMRMESQGRLFIAYAVVNASRMGCFPVLGRWLVSRSLKANAFCFGMLKRPQPH